MRCIAKLVFRISNTHRTPPPGEASDGRAGEERAPQGQLQGYVLPLGGEGGVTKVYVFSWELLDNETTLPTLQGVRLARFCVSRGSIKVAACRHTGGVPHSNTSSSCSHQSSHVYFARVMLTTARVVAGAFDVITLGHSMTHRVKDDLRALGSPGAVLAMEDARFMMCLTKEQEAEFRRRVDELAVEAGWTPLGEVADISPEHHLFRR